jgi:NAD(P)-dependent dehydrogenase (short-subunit alcohol dehydrogenase family)
MNLKGKRALVTGGSRGVGAAVARALAAAGARVAVNYRVSRREAQAVAREIGGVAVRGDVGRRGEAVVAEAARALGGLDLLVNNAGLADPRGWTDDLEKMSDDLWMRVLRADLLGAFKCSRAAARVLRRGKIVNVASIPALVGDREGLVYAAAKAAVVGMTKSLAVLLAPRIQVNCVAFGSLATSWVEWLPPARRAAYRRAIPLGRFGTPEEAAQAVLFLAENDWVTGQTLVLDGGEARV